MISIVKRMCLTSTLAVASAACVVGDGETLAPAPVIEEADEALPLANGASGPLVREANEYLLTYGYFPNAKLSESFPGFRPVVPRAPADMNRFDENTELSIRKFQQNLALPVNGLLDAETLALMHKPRCGSPDRDPSDPHLAQKWALNGGRWNKTAITFRFATPNTGLGSLTAAQTRTAITNGIRTWESVTNLTFAEVASGGDFVINYAAIDGGGNILAQASAPPSPGMGFDTAEGWTVNFLQSVAIHEAGHVIGLGHSSVDGGGVFQPAVMWPVASGRLWLHEDDIIASNSLYNAWEKMPGLATDIGVNSLSTAPADVVWILGHSFANGHAAYHWNGSAWDEKPGVRGLRIDVDKDGDAWMIGNNNRIYRTSGFGPATWEEVPGDGHGTDIGIGPDGDVFIIGMNGNAYRYDTSIQDWVSAGGPGNGIAIDVDIDGTPWVIKSNNEVWFRNMANTWVQQANALGQDVGIGGTSDAFAVMSYRWVIGMDDAPWIHDEQSSVSIPCGAGSCVTPSADQWVRVAGGAKRISAGRQGRAYLVNSAGNIYRRLELP